ncbi:MAG: isochorismatase family cysteine hydrolase [Alphaproteobacteria bacterium]|jgi:nicotinamidase-related amidase|nr:isochorismatase family cysteine hydrolase [Alphaproteobacteria bacterium]
MISEAERLEAPALVVVDMQNDFVREGAPLEVPDARATIPAHQALIRRFRELERPIVYTKFLSTPYPSLLWNWSEVCAPPTKCCWKGHMRGYGDMNRELDCSDVIDEIYPETDDLIVEKHGYGAFHGTPLDNMLRVLEVRSLVVTGTVTQICVEETAREAFHYGYRTTLVADAVSSFEPELHAATLKNFAMKFGWAMRSDEALALL